jgi:hypothetical protein
MFHIVLITIFLAEGIAFGYDIYHNYMTKDTNYYHHKTPMYYGKSDRNR